VIYRLYHLLFNRTVLIFLGLLAISLIIWFVGPMVAIGTWRPFESTTVRWILIALIFLAWGLRILFGWWRAKDMNAKLLNQIAKAREPKADASKAPSSEDVEELRKRFESALTTLKKARVASGEKAGRFAFMSGGGRQYLYQLPWYLFIGPPGSGKTTALINSGLQFPLAEQFGKGGIRGVGGTRNCDWWFTNDAVLLDTAGRYTTQESNEEVDKAEWGGFLRLLKKFRKKQPINGVLLTVSVPDLIAGESQRQLQAAQLRKRLYELHDELGIEFPVYLMVTKADLLAGFNEYFASLTKEDRAQVWGFTLPYAEDGRHDQSQVRAAYETEFDLLQKRLDDGLPDMLLNEADQNRRSIAYTLPQQFAGLRAALGEVVESVFTESKFAGLPILRGVYFTSGTQEGTPFDRVLGALGRAFRIEGGVAASAPGTGKSYFLQNLMQKVVFAESHLAGRDIKAEKRSRLLTLGGYAAIGLALVGAIVAWVVSYRGNGNYLVDVAAQTATLEKDVQKVGKTLNDDILSLLPVLDRAESLASTPKVNVADPPLSHTFGLYQGDKMAGIVDGSYRRMLEDALVPRVAQRIENLLRNAPPDNLELAYEALKAYLMLQEPEHFDGENLTAFVVLDWARTLPREVPKEQRASLERHMSNLFNSGHAVVSPIPLDATLVAQTRQRLAQYSLAQRTFSRMKRQLGKTQLPEFSVANAGGIHAPLVFARVSGKPLTEGVPGLFSYRGYHEVFSKDVRRAATLLGAEEAWVMGHLEKTAAQQLDEAAQGKLVDEIKRQYMHEYVKVWEDYLNDITLIPRTSLTQSIEVARILSGPDSPLALLLRAVAKETKLIKDPSTDRSSLTARAKAEISAARSDMASIFGSDVVPSGAPLTEQIELIVDRRFETLHRLVGAPGGSQAPLDATLALINDVYVALTATDAALRGGTALPNSDVAVRARAEAGRLPQPLRNMLEGLSATGEAQAAGVARSAVGANLNAAVGDFCRKAIAGRYPFTRSSGRDVAPDDFSRMFSSGGLMDDFFQRNLAQMVDISKTPWQFRQSGGGAASSASLTAFQHAATIRDVFFRGGPQAQISLDIKPLEMDSSISQVTLDIDGQVIKYSGGQALSQRVNWPGPRGSNQVRMQLSPQDTNSVLVTEGPWAIYRFFDRAQVQAGNSPEKLKATFNLDGRRLVLAVNANSVQNPLRLREFGLFSCPGKF
jgi:type VI secretion system protein ImpL